MKRHIIDELDNFYSKSIESLIPEEIWQVIFTFVYIPPNLEFFQLMLKKLSCVCSSWAKIVGELVQIHFKGNLKFHSNWVLSHFTDLTTLSLSSPFVGDGHFAVEDKGIEKLTKLTSLILCSNKLISNEALTKLKNLTHLELFDNRNITNEALTKLTKLNNLILGRNNSITSDAINQLANLEKLDLYYCENVFYEGGFNSLINLSELVLSYSVPVEDAHLMNLTNLTKLSLYGPKITDKSVQHFTRLESLCIHNNLFITDECLMKLTNLTSLELRDSQLSYGIKSLHKLTI